MSPAISNSELKPVYYKIKQVNGKWLFRRAPFDVMVVNGAPYMQPRNIGMPDKAFDRLGEDGAENKDTWRDCDFAYEVMEPIVTEENAMGDGSDNWMGVHSMSGL